MAAVTIASNPTVELPKDYSEKHFVADQIKQKNKPLVKEGDCLPIISFSRLKPDGKETEELTTFGLFYPGLHFIASVPGAFTPTCDRHLPELLKVHAIFSKYGIQMHVMAVNNRDVMHAWLAKHEALGKISPIPDRQGKIALAMGIAIDKSEPRDLGLVARRGSYFVYVKENTDVVRFIRVSMEVDDKNEDASGTCTRKSNGLALLEQIPAVLKELNIVFMKGMETPAKVDEEDVIWV